MFDPYHKWLGIPPGQRPPTHYQLLGIAPGERDLEVIEEAALGRTAHLRTYQSGPHAQECTKLLNEIAQAKLVLRDPAQRKEYDSELAKEKREEQEYLARAKFKPYNAPLESELPSAQPAPKPPAAKTHKAKRRHFREPRKKSQSPIFYIAVSVGVTALVVLGAVTLLGGKGTKEEIAEYSAYLDLFEKLMK